MLAYKVYKKIDMNASVYSKLNIYWDMEWQKKCLDYIHKNKHYKKSYWVNPNFFVIFVNVNSQVMVMVIVVMIITFQLIVKFLSAVQ